MEDKNESSSEFKPGETIRPSDVPVEPMPQPQVGVPTAAPQQVAAPIATESPASEASPTVEPSKDSVVSQQSSEPTGVQTEDEQTITWTASEFVDHDKSFDWYLGLSVAAVLAAVVLYLLFRDIITSITPIVAAIALGIYGRRKPRQLQYKLDSEGISIAEKFFPYDMFRSFAVLEDGAFASIAFLPLKRFGLLTTVYLDPQDEERIIDLISRFLPFEPREHDAVDRFMKKIRF